MNNSNQKFTATSCHMLYLELEELVAREVDTLTIY
jgi:hypothetical protein